MSDETTEHRADSFAKAEEHFRAHPDTVKWRRNTPGSDARPNSFIKIGDKIYRLEGKGQYLGRGSYATAKLAIDKDGNQFAIRIEDVVDDKPSPESALAKTAGLTIATAVRDTTSSKSKGDKPEKRAGHTKKEYQVQKLGKPFKEHCSTLTDAQRTALAFKLILALAKLHESGIVHHDIKPDNIVIDEQGNPFFIDFGFAHHADPFSDHYDLDDAAPGTALYALNRAARAQSTFAQLDIHALMKVLYLPKIVSCGSSGYVFPDRINNFYVLPDHLMSSQFAHFLTWGVDTELKPDTLSSCEALFADLVKLDIALCDNDHNLRLLRARALLTLMVENPDKKIFSTQDIDEKSLSLIQGRHGISEEFFKEWPEKRRKQFLKQYAGFYYPHHRVGINTLKFLMDENTSDLVSVSPEKSRENKLLPASEEIWLTLKASYQLGDQIKSIEAINGFLTQFDTLKSIADPLTPDMVAALYSHIAEDKEGAFDFNAAIDGSKYALILKEANIITDNRVAVSAQDVERFCAEYEKLRQQFYLEKLENQLVHELYLAVIINKTDLASHPDYLLEILLHVAISKGDLDGFFTQGKTLGATEAQLEALLRLQIHGILEYDEILPTDEKRLADEHRLFLERLETLSRQDLIDYLKDYTMLKKTAKSCDFPLSGSVVAAILYYPIKDNKKNEVRLSEHDALKELYLSLVFDKENDIYQKWKRFLENDLKTEAYQQFLKSYSAGQSVVDCVFDSIVKVEGSKIKFFEYDDAAKSGELKNKLYILIIKELNKLAREDKQDFFGSEENTVLNTEERKKAAKSCFLGHYASLKAAAKSLKISVPKQSVIKLHQLISGERITPENTIALLFASKKILLSGLVEKYFPDTDEIKLKIDERINDFSEQTTDAYLKSYAGLEDQLRSKKITQAVFDFACKSIAENVLKKKKKPTVNIRASKDKAFSDILPEKEWVSDELKDHFLTLYDMLLSRTDLKPEYEELNLLFDFLESYKKIKPFSAEETLIFFCADLTFKNPSNIVLIRQLFDGVSLTHDYVTSLLGKSKRYSCFKSAEKSAELERMLRICEGVALGTCPAAYEDAKQIIEEVRDIVKKKELFMRKGVGGQFFRQLQETLEDCYGDFSGAEQKMSPEEILYQAEKIKQILHKMPRFSLKALSSEKNDFIKVAIARGVPSQVVEVPGYLVLGANQSRWFAPKSKSRAPNLADLKKQFTTSKGAVEAIQTKVQKEVNRLTLNDYKYIGSSEKKKTLKLVLFEGFLQKLKGLSVEEKMNFLSVSNLDALQKNIDALYSMYRSKGELVDVTDPEAMAAVYHRYGALLMEPPTSMKTPVVSPRLTS